MKNQVRVTLMFLFFAASLGLILRLIQAGFAIHNFKYILHTHSHIALLGWVYNGAYILCAHYLLNGNERHLNHLFWVSQVTFVGMLLSFPFQGYGLVSITFATLYLFCSYYLVYLIFKFTHGDKPYFVFLRWGGIYLALSSIGPFALGYFMANGMGDTPWYNLSIYWFLHFLYNGFFVFVILAFVLKNETYQLTRRVFLWMNTSILPLFALSTLWTSTHGILFILAFCGAAFQAIALWIYVKSKNYPYAFLRKNGAMVRLCFLAYVLKVLFQLIACFTPVQQFVNNTVPYTVIGFIHLVMIGFFTFALLSIFYKQKLLLKSRLSGFGNFFLISGFILSEILLFSQGIFKYFDIQVFNDFFMTLSLVSTLMPMGIALILMATGSRVNGEH